MSKRSKKSQPTDKRRVAFSVMTTKAEIDTLIAGLSLVEGCAHVRIRSHSDRTNGYDKWEVMAEFPYSAALAAQDGAVVLL